MQNKDKFGFYKVSDLKFYSKLDAAQVASQTGQKLTWHFNDEVFGLYNWSVEPTASLSELYRIRAQQIRDQYDYVILWYSGGADSDNILDTFVDNNIRLDEAAGLINMAADGNKDGYLNGEVFNITVPKIQRIKETSQPWIVHTLVDLCQPTMDYFSNQNNKFDWIHKVSHYVNPNYMARSQIAKTQARWMNLINSGKKVAFVHGVDKPKIANVNNRFFLVFRDILDAAGITYNQIDELPGLFNEVFYWTPDLPELVIKQAHVLKRFMKSLTTSSSFLTSEKADRHPSISINGQMYWLTVDGVHTAIYPKWHPRPFQVKPDSLIFTPRDSWFFSLPDTDIAKQTWRQGLEHTWKTAPNMIKSDVNSLKYGFKVITSCAYDIGN